MYQFASKHNLGDVVYLVTDEQQCERLVSEISFKGSGAVAYGIAFAMELSYHYDFEISSQRDLNKLLNIKNNENLR